ncbi:MAG: hypothetical protein ACD_12C00012G0001 [uncultured bacterium]|nr:MAG: hypothetical protein ACD_12C00012G0001 [uncultured bacterium]
MCTACVIAIGGGLFFAGNLGIVNLFIIGLLTVLLSMLTDLILRKINHGKALFPYQRVIVPIVLLFITIAVAKFLL